jgi:trehalose synthase
MTVKLDDYREIAGPGVIDELRVLSERVRGRRMQHINSTRVGGGVAELLTRLVPLFNELGLEASWDVIQGDQAFFAVTKAFHNALQGKPEELTPAMYDTYRSHSEANLREMNFTGDVIFIHDPQPAELVLRKKEIGRGWVWRCHIDVSKPQPDVWNFLQPYLEQYDAAIFSMPDFARPLPCPQFRIAPSIDPLSDKNKPLEQRYVTQVLEKYHIDPGRPVLTQISRFDHFKDPIGVIAAYRLVKDRHRCQLVLAGGGASDDPEGEDMLHHVQAAAADDPDIHVLLLPPYSDLEINALVRGSTVILQKSIREGFGLTVAEALWKKKPVIGGAVGGIKLQVLDGLTGFLVHSPEEAANRIVQLLRDRKLRETLGANGHLHVKQNFLVTRDAKDYILTMLALEHPGESIINL